jgi:hypothetical protein
MMQEANWTESNPVRGTTYLYTDDPCHITVTTTSVLITLGRAKEQPFALPQRL